MVGEPERGGGMRRHVPAFAWCQTSPQIFCAVATTSSSFRR
jgi:hypothetical protein